MHIMMGFCHSLYHFLEHHVLLLNMHEDEDIQLIITLIKGYIFIVKYYTLPQISIWLMN